MQAPCPAFWDLASVLQGASSRGIDSASARPLSRRDTVGASSLLGVAPPQDWGPPLALSDVRDRLRITKFVWEAPRQPYYDFTFLWNVVLRDYEFMGDLEHRGLVDRVLGPHVSTRPPSAGEKQEFAEFMNTLADHERALNFRCMFGRTLDRDQLSALQAEAKFTVPLLDGMEVLQLNTWREMMRREDWEEIPAPAGEA